MPRDSCQLCREVTHCPATSVMSQDIGIVSNLRSGEALNAIRDALDHAGRPGTFWESPQTASQAGLGAKTEVPVEVKSWEQLMGDIACIATTFPRRSTAHARVDHPQTHPPWPTLSTPS